MNNSLEDKVIQNSDDDDESDSPLEDLSTLLASRMPDVRARLVQKDRNIPNRASSISNRSLRSEKSSSYQTPLKTKSNYKYDLKSLARLTKNYDDTEASSNRVGKMLELQNQIGEYIKTKKTTVCHLPNSTQADLLGTVGAGENGKRQEVDQIRCAIEMTEAVSKLQRWYFFHLQAKITHLPRKPFPIDSFSENLKNEMSNSELRNHAFISGFFEDMVTMGKALPDDIFLWLIEELCWQECDVLRNCYINVLTQCTNQIQSLVSPQLVINLFVNVNGTLEATNTERKIQVIEEIPEYYSNHDWSTLLSLLKLFSRIANALRLETRTKITCLLLRMSVDFVVLNNVDIFDNVVNTLMCICNSIPTANWEKFCEDICASIFHCIEQQTLRLRVIESLTSLTTRSHDIRRRLATCFLFNDLKFSEKPSQFFFNFPMFLNRLKAKDFKINTKTDYGELRALIILMDIAVDNGRSSNSNFCDELEEESFNNDVENLSMSVKEILSCIGILDSGCMPKIQAKEAIEDFSHRIKHTMRTKPKLVHEWFRGASREKCSLKERYTMENFITKMKSCKRKS